MYRVLGLCGLLLATVNAAAAGLRLQLDNPAPQRILFVGNSYLYYNDSLHNHVRRMVAELRPQAALQYKSATIGGARLAHHNLAHLLSPGSLGIDAPFELVILQGGSGESLTSAARQQFTTQARAMARRSRAAGSEVALYMTHAYVPPHPRAAPDMLAKVVQTYRDTAQQIDALVIPVGLAFERAYAARPHMNLHKAFDGSHPDLPGTYLAACVVLASVYQLSPVGLQYTYFGAIDPADAAFLQRIALDTVNNWRADHAD